MRFFRVETLYGRVFVRAEAHGELDQQTGASSLPPAQRRAQRAPRRCAMRDYHSHPAEPNGGIRLTCGSSPTADGFSR
jgi:hypothetical protein